jgi:hypothetical protein
LPGRLAATADFAFANWKVFAADEFRFPETKSTAEKPVIQTALPQRGVRVG